MSEVNTGTSGIGFLGILFMIFLVLKLTKVIAWSWVWVTSPLWAIPTILLTLGVLIVGGIIIFGSVD